MSIIRYPASKASVTIRSVSFTGIWKTPKPMDGIIGHLSLLQNPVMRLSPHDFGKCVCDMERLRQVSEHTARMNFSSFSYFSRYVSRHFGISPNAYRESLNRVR